MAGENVSASPPSRMDMINSLFVRGEELMAKLGCQVFILVSEDGIKSNYAGSEVFLRQFHTCGLKINPGDTERTQEKIHTHMLSEKSVYNRDITYRYGNSQRVLDSIVQNNQSLNFLVIKEEEPPYSGCAVSVVTTETPRTDSYLATDVVSNVAATEQKDENIDADKKTQISVKEYFSANKSVQGSNVDEEEMATSVTMETDADMKTSTPESSSFTEEESKYAEKDEKDDAVLLPGNQSCCEEDSEGSDTSDGKKVLGDDEEEIKEKDERDDTMLLPGNQSCGEEDLGGRDTSDGRKVLEDDEEEIKAKDERDDAVLLSGDQNCGEEDPDGCDTSDERKMFDDDQEETKDKIQDMRGMPSEKLCVPLESGIKFPLNKRKSKEGSFTEMNLRERRPGKREKEKFKATEGNSPKRKPKNQKKGNVNKMREEQSGSVSMERECLKRLKCDEADDPEKFRDLVKKIFTESNESKTNLCEKCGISFKSPCGLECHKKIVDCAERKCQYCGLTFWFRPWQQHVINDHLRRIVIYECNTCGKQYLKRLDFNIHYETHEPDDTSCVCTICGLELQNVRSLKSHERFMHHVTEMKCDFCDYKTVRKHQLVKHMQRHTNGDKFKCKDCGKQLISGNSLRRHMERFHLKLNYHCSDCGKAFALRHALNLHVARHHQENPTLFICEKCGKGYHTRTLLTSHLRVTHSDQTVQCEICGKAFTHVAKLRQHLVIHDKAKFLTIPCERCPKKFRHKSRLKRHMVAVHSDIKYHCEFYCQKVWNVATIPQLLKLQKCFEKSTQDLIRRLRRGRLDYGEKTLIVNMLHHAGYVAASNVLDDRETLKEKPRIPKLYADVEKRKISFEQNIPNNEKEATNQSETKAKNVKVKGQGQVKGQVTVGQAGSSKEADKQSVRGRGLEIVPPAIQLQDFNEKDRATIVIHQQNPVDLTNYQPVDDTDAGGQTVAITNHQPVSYTDARGQAVAMRETVTDSTFVPMTSNPVPQPQMHTFTTENYEACQYTSTVNRNTPTLTQNCAASASCRSRTLPPVTEGNHSYGFRRSSEIVEAEIVDTPPLLVPCASRAYLVNSESELINIATSQFNKPEMNNSPPPVLDNVVNSANICRQNDLGESESLESTGNVYYAVSQSGKSDVYNSDPELFHQGRYADVSRSSCMSMDVNRETDAGSVDLSQSSCVSMDVKRETQAGSTGDVKIEVASDVDIALNNQQDFHSRSIATPDNSEQPWSVESRGVSIKTEPVDTGYEHPVHESVSQGSISVCRLFPDSTDVCRDLNIKDETPHTCEGSCTSRVAYCGAKSIKSETTDNSSCGEPMQASDCKQESCATDEEDDQLDGSHGDGSHGDGDHGDREDDQCSSDDSSIVRRVHRVRKSTRRKTHSWISDSDSDSEDSGVYRKRVRRCGQRRNQANPYRCSECGQLFRNRGNYSKHRRMHAAMSPIECPDCDKVFNNKFVFKRHKQLHRKRYKCETCDKDFCGIASLTMHMRIHTGEKPYSCPECGKLFTQKGHVGVHMLVHQTERPYQCSECQKCFKSTHDLNSHMKTHDREKRFECEICGKKFKYKAYRKTHMKVHTKEQVWRDNIETQYRENREKVWGKEASRLLETSGTVFKWINPLYD